MNANLKMIALQEYIPPSLGKIGEFYYDHKNNRIKYFCTQIHHSLDPIEELVEEGISRMRTHHATRLNARFFAKKGLFLQDTEAVIPLEDQYSDLNLLFIGVNQPSRLDSAYVKEKEDILISEVFSDRKKHRHNLDGYLIDRLNFLNATDQDIHDIVRLYHECFPTYTSVLDEDSVRSMIEHSVVYSARFIKTGKLVSLSVGEIGRIETSRGEFVICELSEMATKNEHRGRGLVTSITHRLIGEISPSVDLMYAEARACHKPINQSFFNMGFQYAGRLNKQCILSGVHEVSEKGPYENLNVWYLLQPKLT
jgi:hypothetical protein